MSQSEEKSRFTCFAARSSDSRRPASISPRFPPSVTSSVVPVVSTDSRTCYLYCVQSRGKRLRLYKAHLRSGTVVGRRRSSSSFNEGKIIHPWVSLSAVKSYLFSGAPAIDIVAIPRCVSLTLHSQIALLLCRKNGILTTKTNSEENLNQLVELDVGGGPCPSLSKICSDPRVGTTSLGRGCCFAGASTTEDCVLVWHLKQRSTDDDDASDLRSRLLIRQSIPSSEAVPFDQIRFFKMFSLGGSGGSHLILVLSWGSSIAFLSFRAPLGSTEEEEGEEEEGEEKHDDDFGPEVFEVFDVGFQVDQALLVSDLRPEDLTDPAAVGDIMCFGEGKIARFSYHVVRKSVSLSTPTRQLADGAKVLSVSRRPASRDVILRVRHTDIARELRLDSLQCLPLHHYSPLPKKLSSSALQLSFEEVPDTHWFLSGRRFVSAVEIGSLSPSAENTDVNIPIPYPEDWTGPGPVRWRGDRFLPLLFPLRSGLQKELQVLTEADRLGQHDSFPSFVGPPFDLQVRQDTVAVLLQENLVSLDLRRSFRRENLVQSENWRIPCMRRMAHLVRSLHEMGFIHGDLTSSCFCHPEIPRDHSIQTVGKFLDSVKLCSFRASQRISRDRDVGSEEESPRLHTAPYFPYGETLSITTDIYLLGICFCEVLIEKPLTSFASDDDCLESPRDRIDACLDSLKVREKGENESVLFEVLNKMLHQDHSERPSLDDIVKGLEGADLANTQVRTLVTPGSPRGVVDRIPFHEVTSFKRFKPVLLERYQ